MNKRSGRFFITYFFTSLFLLLLLLPCFPGNASAEKTVDPYYLWHLFTGSAKMESEVLHAVVTDDEGNIFIAAEANMWNSNQETDENFGKPGKPLNAHSGGNPANRDMMVVKFDHDGNYIWHTFAGGLGYDSVRGMAIAPDGRLYITGTSRDNWTYQGREPKQAHSLTLGLYDGSGLIDYRVSDDIYVICLDANGGEYQWHTFKGEFDWDEQVYGIAADRDRVFLVGKADAEFFGCWPKPNNKKWPDITNKVNMKRHNRLCRPKRNYQGSNDAWVMALTIHGDYVMHTFLGGMNTNDWGEAIAIDQNGMVVVAGSSSGSWDYSWDENGGVRYKGPRNDHVGRYDMFIARLARSDLNYHWHSFFGGGYDDWATAVVTDGNNGYYLAGYSDSGWRINGRAPVDWHTEGINYDFVVVKMNNEGAYGWHTFRGGQNTEDVPHAMAMSRCGDYLVVAGEARGPWTLVDGKKPLHSFTGSTIDMAILGLNPENGMSNWHTFYGSDCNDRAYAAAISNATGDIVVAGVSDKTWKGKDDIGKQVNPKWQFPSEREGLNANFAVLKLRPYKYTIDASVKNGFGGTMDPSGSVAVAYLKDQTFTLKPDTGYMVKQVLVDGKAVTIVNNTYTFEKVAADHTIEVTFEKKTLTISAYSFDAKDGTVSPNGEISVTYGADQKFSFTPAQGKVVVGVKVDGTYKAYSNNSYTFKNVTGNHSIRAYFGYIITATAETGGKIAPSGSVGVIANTDQKFDITPDLGWEIDQVYVNGEKAGNTSQFKFTNVSKNNTIRATFKKKTFTITVSQGQGGTINPADNVVVSWGDNQDFYITADTANGYVIDTLTADNKTVDAASGQESYKHTFSNVTANHSISVTFKLKTLVIKASAGAGGTIDPSGNVNVTYGDSKTFTITADTANKYVIDKLLDDGNEVAGVSGSKQYSYTYTNVHSTHTIEARFKQHADQYTITASAGTGGTIDPSGSIQVAYGADQTFTITADTANHYAIDKVLVNGNSVPDVSGKATAQYTFHTVSRNSTIEATFKRVFTITAQAGTGGAIDPSGSIPVMGGSDKTFNITADTDNGYRIDELLVDGIKDEAASGLPTYSKTFTNVLEDHRISVTFTMPATKYIITASAGTGGTIDPPGNVEVPAHGSQTFNIRAESGYEIDQVLVDGVAEGKEPKYTFNDVIQNHTIEATFTKSSVPGI